MRCSSFHSHSNSPHPLCNRGIGMWQSTRSSLWVDPEHGWPPAPRPTPVCHPGQPGWTQHFNTLLSHVFRRPQSTQSASRSKPGHCLEGAPAAVRALCTLGISAGPPGDICNHQEACRKEPKLSRSLWDSFTAIKTQGDRSCACNCAFLGFYGLFGWVHLGMVHRWFDHQ